MEIKVLTRQGHGIREVAKQMGVSRNTVRRYLRDPQAQAGQRKTGAPRVTLLDAYRDTIAQRLAAAAPHWIPATVILREIAALGYTGSTTQLRRYMASLRPVKPPEPLIRFETAPGVQMQCDWVVFRRGAKPLSAFVATLGYSRASYVRFVTDEKLATLLSCHVSAFEFFAGIPKQILYDNMKTVVIERDAYGQGEHKFQAAFVDFATHHGFVPKLCRPYRAKTKGKVERFNGYLRRSFYNPLVAKLAQIGGAQLQLDVDMANTEVLRWLREVANARTHGTTARVPREALIEEQAALQPLGAPYKAVLPMLLPSASLPSALQPSAHKAVPSTARACELPQLVIAPMQHPLSVYAQLLERA